MDYRSRIKALASKVAVELVDFDGERSWPRVPTQASSEFITNKEQGDWAEKLLMTAINNGSKNFIAVHYGKNEDLVAGENGFDAFFDEFQTEMDTIGKRPDLLVFNIADYREDLGLDISRIPHELIDDYVRKAVAGIEVRSSAFLIDKYEEYMQARSSQYIAEALRIRDEILARYSHLLQHNNRLKYKKLFDSIDEETIHVLNFKVPGWRSSAELIALNDMIKELKKRMNIVQKRDYLSITPKVEDLKVVYKWIDTFNVPHFYFQVFFDKIYGMSFEQILSIISDSDNEGTLFSVEKDAKNQNKTTIKIRSSVGTEIASKVDEPNHHSKRKEMDRGRLLFYVAFDSGHAYLDVEGVKSLLKIDCEEF